MTSAFYPISFDPGLAPDHRTPPRFPALWSRVDSSRVIGLNRGDDSRLLKSLATAANPSLSRLNQEIYGVGIDRQRVDWVQGRVFSQPRIGYNAYAWQSRSSIFGL